ncbi:MAG: YbhB/YbcL family Raf kinase inhibitor-like protein [Ilumatobacteraceae bacterium]
MRRIALLTSTCLLLLMATSCRHDGRTLRPPKAQQDSTISVVIATESTLGFDDPDITEFLLPEETAAGDTDTFPTNVTEYVAVAPWRDGAAIDERYTCDGLNVAPALSWSAAPVGTVEIAITLTDLDAPGFAHWGIAGIPATNIALNEDTVPLGAYEAMNGNGALGYTGPCPPAGEPHTYAITVHYLGGATGLDDGVSVAELITAIDSSALASAEVTGTFSRG